MMISLCYVSSSTCHFSQDELISLLGICHTNNQSMGITGLLLYKKGTFIQALEGDDVTVNSLYAKIKEDPRHQRVNCISKIIIKERDFPDWKMGFRNLNQVPNDYLSVFSDFMDVKDLGDYLLERPSVSRSLLLHFKASSEELIF